MSWTAMLNYTAGHGLPFAFWWKRRFGEDRPSTEITFGIGTDLVRNDWYTNWFTHGIKLFFAGWPVRSHCGWNVPFGTIFTLYGSACRRTNRLRMSYVPPADQTQLHTHTHTQFAHASGCCSVTCLAGIPAGPTCVVHGYSVVSQPTHGESCFAYLKVPDKVRLLWAGLA